LKHEKCRVRKESRIIGAERKLGGEGRKSILLLEGSQAMPARPSDKDRMKMKTLV
jgi:hypothetical protein